MVFEEGSVPLKNINYVVKTNLSWAALKHSDLLTRSNLANCQSRVLFNPDYFSAEGGENYFLNSTLFYSA